MTLAYEGEELADRSKKGLSHKEGTLSKAFSLHCPYR
jgi:hypothetical protein